MNDKIPVYVDKKPKLTWGSSFIFECDCKTIYECHRHYPKTLTCVDCKREYAFVYELETNSASS